MFARELSVQLAGHGWNSVLCFPQEPAPVVRQFLDLPNIEIEVIPTMWKESLETFWRLSAVLRRHRPQVAHFSFVNPVSFYPWVCRLHGVPRTFFTDQVSRPEGTNPTPAPAWKRTIGGILNSPLTAMIAVSDYNARATRATGLVPADRVTRIYNAVDLSRPIGSGESFREKYEIPEGRKVVLKVSWIIPEKGHDDLLAAVPAVIAKEPNVHFVFAGEGRHRDRYMAEAERSEIREHVTFTGMIDDPIASGVYASADIVCQLSRWQEAFGWTNTEAMLCGKPVIATRVGGVPEIVEAGESGLLIEPRQPRQVAESILRLLADPDLRQRMGARGRQIVEEKFNLRKTVAEHLKLYGIH